MAITFDGDNLIITLDSGATEVDVFEDIYESWKDWMLGSAANRRYPQAFSSDGGNPLTSIINQGGYIFLNNAAGWRLKPPEEDITIYLTGNLAVLDTSLDAFVPTDGAFTAAIIGLQPVTQGVTPAMASQLEVNVFQNNLCIDAINGTSGTGYVGLDPIGTRRAPSNNLADAKAIADRNGIVNINFLGDFNTGVDVTDFSAGYRFTSDSPFITVTLGAGVDVSNCAFENMTLTGAVDGVNSIRRCEVDDITGFSGEMLECDLLGDIGVIAPFAHLRDCYSVIAGDSQPTLTGIGTTEIIVRAIKGSIGLAGMTGGTHSIGCVGGRIVFENTCTGGNAHVRNTPFEVVDNSGGLVTIVDQTEGQKVREMHKQRGLRTDDPYTITPSAESSQSGDIDIALTGDGIASTTLTRQ